VRSVTWTTRAKPVKVVSLSNTTASVWEPAVTVAEGGEELVDDVGGRQLVGALLALAEVDDAATDLMPRFPKSLPPLSTCRTDCVHGTVGSA
jgi:hypothetical protein